MTSTTARRRRAGLCSVLNVASALMLLLAVVRVTFFMRYSSQSSSPSLKGVTDTANPSMRATSREELMRRDRPQYSETGETGRGWTPLEKVTSSTSERRHPDTGRHHDLRERERVAIETYKEQLALRHSADARSEGRPLSDEQSFNSVDPLLVRSFEVGGQGVASEGWGKGRKVLIFTMDSLDKTIANASRGGPAGEIKIRESLTKALTEAGAQVVVAGSDRDFAKKASQIAEYDAIVLDPWTWGEKGWRLKGQLKGREKKIFIMDFFGSEIPHANLGVPTQRFLTAFPTPIQRGYTFLGYRIDGSELPAEKTEKKQQGIIWGKTGKSLGGHTTKTLLNRLADVVELHSTVSPRDVKGMHLNSKIVFHGVLTKDEWRRLLQESKFMIGLGDPLSGPSAVDAVMAGCVYINPTYISPQKVFYTSQHPYLEQAVGEPYVCSYKQQDVEGALDCARKALEQDLDPMLPSELTKAAHEQRVRHIFGPSMGS